MKKNIRFNAQKPNPLKTGEIPCKIPWTCNSRACCFGYTKRYNENTMPNFIIHFNKCCEIFGNDDRFTISHLALYVSLFYHWNKKKFINNMPISRDDVMQIACMGSYTTYHRSLKDLHEWGYIEYTPSHHPNIPSRVTVYDIIALFNPRDFDTTPDTTTVPGVVPSINSLNVVNGVNETKRNERQSPRSC